VVDAGLIAGQASVRVAVTRQFVVDAGLIATTEHTYIR
jgi:hypothetical protein